MVGLSDIPCVGEAVDRISDVTVEAGIRGLRYLLCYDGLVKDLKSEIKNIEVQEGRVSRRVDEERANGKIIDDHVTEWLKETEEIKTRANELFKRGTSSKCFNVMLFPNPFTRIRLGRKAAHEAQNVAKLAVSGVELLRNEIAFLPADENIPISDTAYQKFGSREEAYGKLWEALVKVDGDPVIGIYGMPGVGKTRMMEQAWRHAKEKKVFDKVIRANVGSEKIDVVKLQNQLAEFLGCHLESKDNEMLRASQLKSSLKNMGKILVILDDVWEPIPLKHIGILLGDDTFNGCKILLTSRKEDVCLRNNCKDPIKIETLTVDEAWDMFVNTVGTSKIESLQDTSLAEKVCKECGALPLLIHAVGNAIKFVTEDSWKYALFQLQNCDFDEIDGIESQVYTCIRLSFDNLKKAAKTCILLCSLFPEDAEIEVEMLVDFATGSHLLNRGGNVRGVIDNLKSSSLLLDGEFRGTVKMHDIVRDVARSIAGRDQEYAFLFIRGESCFPVTSDYSTRKLIQFVESHNFGRLTGMVYPNLHTLWLECNNQAQQFPNSFFKGFGNLKSLVVKGMNIFPDQMSVQTLDKLTMLVLDCCDLNEMWLSIVPENLETLRISDCRIPNPFVLSNLKSLRKLVVLSDSEIEMVSNALSPTLAELHIPGGFKIFDAKGKRSVPISSELNRLTALTSLNIRFEDSESCPAENIVANLLDFVIHEGIENYFHARSAMRSIIFKNRCMEGGGEVLVERAEIVILSIVKGSRNGFSNSNNNSESYSNLKKLSIKSCKDMEHLAWTPHYEIKQSQQLISFSKLSFLHIDSCSKLKYLFCACVAKCLMQLQELHIIDCPTLEFVIQNDCTIDGAIIKFPKLKVLTLKSLQSLRRFCGENTGTSSTSTAIMENAATSTAGSDPLFDEMVAFPALEILTIYSLEKNEIWENNCNKNNSFRQLKCLTVRDCSNLEFAIPVAMLLAFQNLEKLVIYDCDSMTSEVESSSSNESLPELVALRSIDLYNIRALTNTRLNCRINFYPKLEILSIRRCNSLRNVFLCSIVKYLVYLKELDVRECEMMSEIIGEGQEEEKTDEFVFPELTKLRLKYLTNFKRFCFNKSVEALGSTHQHQSYSTPKVPFPKLMKLVFNVDTLLEEIEVGKNNSPTEITKLAVEASKEVELPSKWQLQLPNIEKLYLQNFCGHKSFGEQNDGQYLFNPYGTLSFQKLKSVEVHSCGISALFSCSIFSNLHQLQQLKVTDCPLLEEVVRDENNIVGTHQQIISLLQLKSIQLYNLPKLRSFSRSANFAFNMPALALVNLDKCPKMENFTCVEISTPSIPDFNSQFQKYLSHPNRRAKIEW